MQVKVSVYRYQYVAEKTFNDQLPGKVHTFALEEGNQLVKLDTILGNSKKWARNISAKKENLKSTN